jgi:hypothetical protein
MGKIPSYEADSRSSSQETEPEILLQYSVQPASGPYPEPDES